MQKDYIVAILPLRRQQLHVVWVWLTANKCGLWNKNIVKKEAQLSQ